MKDIDFDLTEEGEKIIRPENLTNKENFEVDWIINTLVTCTEDSIESVNIYFKDYKIKFNYQIKIERNNER